MCLRPPARDARAKRLLLCSKRNSAGSCRGTTVYLVQRRIDMLPKPLTEDICSLRSGVDRLAFSVLWEMTDEAEIVGVR
jgi:exoribonuclease II